MYRRLFFFLLLLISVSFLGCVPEKYEYVKEIGAPGSRRGQFSNPVDMVLFPDGKVAISDSGNQRVQVLDLETGRVVRVIGEGLTGRNQLRSLAGIGVHPLSSELWVCDQRGNKLVRFNRDGEPDMRIEDNVRSPRDVAVDRHGNLYVINSRSTEVQIFDEFGSLLRTIGGTERTNLLFPTSISLHEGNIYITDFGLRRILVMDTNGNFIRTYQHKGDYEEIRGPANIFLNENGSMYLLDLGNIPVVSLTLDGELISRIGSFGEKEGEFRYPMSVVAQNGMMYVLDSSRNVIICYRRRSD